MHRPKRTALQGHIPNGQMFNIFQEQQGSAGVEKTLNVPLGDFAVENFLVSVDGTMACDGNVFTILGVEKIVGGGAGVLTVDIAGNAALQGYIASSVKKLIISQIIASLEHSAHR